MKKQIILALVLLSLTIFINNVYACMSDIECPGQGQNICQNKQLSGYHCVDNSCQKSSEIGSVECCSSQDCASDQVCDIQHGYKCAGGAVECTTNVDCGAHQACDTLLYKCVNINPGAIATECTNNAICIEKYGQGYVCDLSNVNWGNCKKQTENSGYCGDGKCESIISETTTSCPDDCLKTINQNTPTNSTYIITLIIGFALIIGFIILGLILRRKNG